MFITEFFILVSCIISETRIIKRLFNVDMWRIGFSKQKGGMVEPFKQ